MGERRLHSLIEKYGVKSLNRHIETILASTEERTRRAISKIPPGTYEASSDTKNDGLSDRSYTARMKAIVEDDHITFDFAGTDPQSPGYINGVFSTSFSATVSVFSMCLDPDLPHNEGSVKPIEVIIPSGTFLNANYPAATVLGNFTCNNVIHECVLKSLSSAIPDKITSGWHRIHGVINTGIDPRSSRDYYTISFVIMKGGSGATMGKDGQSALDIITTQRVRNGFADYEEYELRYPHRILEAEYRADSGGAGKWRGGLGMHTKWLVYAKDPKINVHGENSDAPFGLFGGMDGSSAELWFIEQAREPFKVAPNSLYDISSNTIIDAYTAGGGGFGSPLERSIEDLQIDLKNGYVSPAALEEIYGAVLTQENAAIDVRQTELKRSRIKKSRSAIC